MRDEAATRRIRDLIADFRIPGTDSLHMFVNYPPPTASVYVGVALSTEQKHRRFYEDDLTFWVRACFCFSEDTGEYKLLQEIAPLIDCQCITPQKFTTDLLAAIDRYGDDRLKEGDTPLSSLGLFSGAFQCSDAFQVLDSGGMTSALAKTGDEFIAYFIAPME